ncbi:LysR family transcriptional regulator [Verrucomicrobiaceae bacterium N1E253]|uniref:LysR family transcriptional regulator n=1 Tax=Oceaniferula marina TaxID=2748318 RepID=A0A851GHT4_9BACT|nr:LysR family transcriptional regulator [Oceaniferula marina]NWK56916.1 LysR family transcriptional regulator [Oceaniferula marina]
MNVHHLELFYYVAKYEGITAAVRKMPYGIQQPAVSGQLLQLEKSLGVKLFNRRPFSLTNAGDQLYDHVYPFFSRLADVEENLKGGESKHLRIAASAAVLRHHLPELLADLRKEVPGLRLTLKDVEPSDVHHCLTNQQADLAVSVINARPGDGLHEVELLHLPLMLLLPEDHSAESLDDLLEEGDPEVKIPLVGLPKHEAISQLFQRGVDGRELTWPVAVEVDSLDAVQHFVRCGFGAGVALRIPDMVMPEGVKSIDLDGFPPLVMGVVYQGSLKPIATRFLEAAVDRAQALVKSK